MDEQLLTSIEVASLFRVDPRTVYKWRRKGVLPFLVTPGGQARFRRSEILALIGDNGEITTDNGEL